MEKRAKQPHMKPSEAPRKDRKSGTGTSGAPKKGGHGGKFTWSGDEAHIGGEEPIVAMDRKDPNYVDPEDA
ncbi:hypothetical protein EJ110_NYTH01335 [Nymphaea thermarum]|nr:hypothetical protein EJ110_NYTH01335 [Nymphaea thermarum]